MACENIIRRQTNAMPEQPNELMITIGDGPDATAETEDLGRFLKESGIAVRFLEPNQTPESILGSALLASLSSASVVTVVVELFNWLTKGHEGAIVQVHLGEQKYDISNAENTASLIKLIESKEPVGRKRASLLPKPPDPWD